ncbi:MAG: hypothetical protein IPM80_05625 [Proteobacteria bacterium]|nr:hypothetical protein [Pseudomonadota bacterium]
MDNRTLALIGGLCLAMNAQSSVLYTYEGPNYVEINDGATLGAYTTSMHLEIKLQFSEALEPNSVRDFGVEHLFTPGLPPEFWSVYDGRHYWDSNISGPFEDNPPWVPRFDVARLHTDEHGAISAWDILFAIHNYYPIEHPVSTVHLVYSTFPPSQPETPATLHDVAKVSNADPIKFEFDDEAYTNQSGAWRAVQVVPLPGGAWFVMSALPVCLAMGRRRLATKLAS